MPRQIIKRRRSTVDEELKARVMAKFEPAVESSLKSPARVELEMKDPEIKELIRKEFTHRFDDFTDDDWTAMDQGRKFESPGLGQLADIEENRLAARAYDVMGWPMGLMTGASKSRPGESGLNLRQMAVTKYAR